LSYSTFFLLLLTRTSPHVPPSLHDALPISSPSSSANSLARRGSAMLSRMALSTVTRSSRADRPAGSGSGACTAAIASRSSSSLRSEEHTSELQSRVDLVCRLLLEKKNG